MEQEIFILLAYVIGTVFGLMIKFHGATVVVIESLIEDGFLKTRENKEGEIEVIRYNEK
jgi:hypothetical protein